jgi:hypothetical protein
VSRPGRLVAAAAVSIGVSLAAFAQTSPAPPIGIGGALQADYGRVSVGDLSRDRVFFRRLLLAVHVNVDAPSGAARFLSTVGSSEDRTIGRS